MSEVAWYVKSMCMNAYLVEAPVVEDGSDVSAAISMRRWTKQTRELGAGSGRTEADFSDDGGELDALFSAVGLDEDSSRPLLFDSSTSFTSSLCLSPF